MARKSKDTDKAITAGKVLRVTDKSGDSGLFYLGYKTEVNNNANGFILYPMALHEEASAGLRADENVTVSFQLPQKDDSVLKPISAKKLKEDTLYDIDLSNPIKTVDLLDSGLSIEVFSLPQKSVYEALGKLAVLKTLDDGHSFSSAAGMVIKGVNYLNFASKYLGNAKPLDTLQAAVINTNDKEVPRKRRLTAVPLEDRKRPPSPSVVSSPSHSKFRLQDLFLFTHVQKIDKKGRVSMPSEFRSVASGGNEFALVRHPRKSLLVGSSAPKFLQTVKQDAALSLNVLAPNILRVKFDESGRINLPDNALLCLGMEKGQVGNLTFWGRGTFFEVSVEGHEELSRDQDPYDDAISQQIEHMRWDI